MAHLDKGGVSDAQFNAFVRGGHLVGAQVHCGQQVLRSGGQDSPEAVHLQSCTTETTEAASQGRSNVYTVDLL